MEAAVRERFERIEAILESIARRQDRADRRQDRFDKRLQAGAARHDKFDRQLQAGAARHDKFDRQLQAAAARHDKFDRQLQATAKLVAEGIKIVRTLARDTRELQRSQKAFLDSLRHGGNGRGSGRA